MHKVSSGSSYDEDDSTFTLLAGVMARKAEEMACTKIRGFFYQDTNLKSFLDIRGLVEAEKPYPFMMWKDLPDAQWRDVICDAAGKNRFLYWQTDAF